MTDRAITPINQSAAVDLSRADIDILKATVLKGATDDQLRFFARACKAKGLDPFSREVHGAVNREGGVELIVGIDGLRHQAEQSNEYAGQEAPVYFGDDGQGLEVWPFGKQRRPVACKVCVRRRKIRAVKDSDGVIQTAADIDVTCAVAVTSEVSRTTSTWERHFLTMLAVRAEAHALRRAFPRQASGLYLRDEIDEDGGTTTVDQSSAIPTHAERKKPSADFVPGQEIVQEDPARKAKFAPARAAAPAAGNRPRSRPGQDPATQGDEEIPGPIDSQADADGVIDAQVVDRGGTITKAELDELIGGDSSELQRPNFDDDDENLVNATANEGRQIHQLKKLLTWTDKEYDEACLEQVGQSGALSMAKTKYMIEHMERLAEARGAA